MDKSQDMIDFVKDRPGHDFRYSLDSSKIRNELGWKEKMNFEEGITHTINWYLENEDWRNSIPQNTWENTSWKKI